MSWATVATIAAPIVLGAIGNQQSGGARNDSRNALNGAVSMYQNIANPDIEKMKLNLQEYQDVYGYNPEMAQAEQLGSRDNLQDIQLDPRLKNAQTNALSTLQEIAGKGFTPDQLLAMDQQRRQNEGDLTSRLKGMQDQQAARGVGNSDFGLAQKMMEAQSSANRNAQDNAAMRASAYKNGLDAITQGANLAGSMDNTDYNRQANLANAQNNREMVNLNQRAATNQSNVQTFNDSLKAKAMNRQDISNQNTGIANSQQAHNRGLLQTDFDNSMKKATGVAGGLAGVAAGRAGDAQRTSDMFSGVAGGISTALLSGKK